MSCKSYNCSAPTPNDYCVLHAKQMGIDKPKKMAYVIPKVSERKKISDKLSKPEKQLLDKFFEDALLHAPFHCENCGVDLRESVMINPRCIVCHILPKKKGIGGFPSVAANQINKFYGCNSCHKGYDEQGESFILKMHLLPVIKERVQLLLPHLTEGEINRLPFYLL